MKIFEENGFKQFGHQNVWIKWEMENNSIVSRYFATTKYTGRDDEHYYIIVKDHSENILLSSNDPIEIDGFFKRIRRDNKIDDILKSEM